MVSLSFCVVDLSHRYIDGVRERVFNSEMITAFCGCLSDQDKDIKHKAAETLERVAKHGQFAFV